MSHQGSDPETDREQADSPPIVRQPLVSRIADASIVSLGPAGGELARLITHSNSGADFLLGISWLGPGERMTFDLPASSSGASPAPQEGYLVLEGRVRASWDHGPPLIAGPRDALYFAPGASYEVECIGADQAVIAYVVVPPAR